MAITVQTGFYSRTPGSSLTWPVTLLPGDHRVLSVSAHTRGNPGASAASSVTLRGRGFPARALDLLIDVSTEGVIHEALFELREADFPPDGTYDLVISTGGAFQMILEGTLLSGVEQTLATIVDGHGQRDSETTITLGSQRALVVAPQNGCLLVDATSGDNPFSVVSTLGPPRDFYFPMVEPPLSAARAYTLVDVADGPLNPGWIFGSGMNRICMAYALYQPAGGIPPSAPRQANTLILGAFA